MTKDNSTKNDSQTRLWGLRAGKGGGAHTFFLTNNLLVLDHEDMGDLALIEPNREAFYQKVAEVRPSDTRTGIAGIGGKFYRFAHEMSVGDIIVYPCLLDKKVYLGAIQGTYQYVPTTSPEYPHRRKVRWIGSIPKTSLSQPAIREMGAARTLFEITTNKAEFLRFLSSMQRKSPKGSADDHK